MLIKITTLEEMKEKGWTLEKQIAYEARELAAKYEEEALRDIERAKALAATPDLREMLDWSVLRGQVVGKARQRAWNEAAQKYRRVANDDLGTLREQTT
jgi:hypothetical protein